MFYTTINAKMPFCEKYCSSKYEKSNIVSGILNTPVRVSIKDKLASPKALPLLSSWASCQGTALSPPQGCLLAPCGDDNTHLSML